jgi:solute carrier family 35 protein E3
MSVGREKFQLGTVEALSLSVVSSVSIVICNKALTSSLGFNFGVRSDCFLPPFLDLLYVCMLALHVR